MNRKILYLGLILIGVLLGSVLSYALTPNDTFYISSGVYPGVPTYTIFKDGSVFFAKNALGQNVYSSINASYVINSAVTATYVDGGKILLKAGAYPLDASIKIPATLNSADSRSLSIMGETITGDPLFTKNLNVVPQGTIIESDTGYTGSLFELGYGAETSYFARNIEIAYMTISGLLLPETDEGFATILMASGEAGIKITNGENIDLHHLTLLNCYYGIYTTTNGGTTDAFRYHDSWQAYNVYGYYGIGVAESITIRQVWSYLNYYGGYVIGGQSTDIQDISSNADAFEGGGGTASIILTSDGFIRGRGIFIQSSKDAALSGERGIYLKLGSDNRTISLTDVVVQGVLYDAIYIMEEAKTGNFIYLDRVFASTSPNQILGGDGRIGQYGIYSAPPSTSTQVYLTNSVFADCVSGSIRGNYTWVDNVVLNNATILREWSGDAES